MSEAFDANEDLIERHQGEVLGEALFALLAELEEDEGWRHKWRLLERLERFVGGELRRLLEERSVPCARDEKTVSAGRAAAKSLHAMDGEARLDALLGPAAKLVEDFRGAFQRSPPDLKATAQLVLDHEQAILGFLEAEKAGRGEAAEAVVIDFLEAAGAPEEAPIPEGLALTPMNEAFREDPNPALSLLRERAPVHRDRGWGGQVVLSRHDDVVRIVRDLDFWVDPRKSNPGDPVRQFFIEDGDGREPSMLFLDDPDHRRLRKLVSGPFTPRAVEQVRPLIAEVARELMDALDEHDLAEFDVIEALAAPLPAIAIARLLGVDPKDQARFKAWSVASSEAFFNPFAEEAVKTAAMEARVELDALFRNEIAKRRAEPRGDLIGTMVKAEADGDRMSEQEIVTMCNLLLIAGNVTTTDLIGNGVAALLAHPDQLQKLVARPELMANAVEEMLRFDPPVTASGRIAPRDVEIGGIPVRKGESLSILLSAANRDPAIYPEPDRFDIERADTHHSSFGGGHHLCLGAHLARAEAQEAIGALLARYPWLHGPAKPLRYKLTPGFRGLESLFVHRG
jgi:cytochrome P450